MAAHIALPTANDVTTALGAMTPAITLPGGFDTASEVAAAIDEWNRRTRYRPFFYAGGGQQLVLIDPPGPDRSPTWGGGGRELLLPNGIISLVSLANQYDASQSPPTSNLLTINRDFWAMPSNAPSYSPPSPYTMIKFVSPQRGNPGSIAITAVWGYCAGSLPDDAWKAIRDLAISNCLQVLIATFAVNATSWKEGEWSESRDPGSLTRMGGMLRAGAERALGRYRLYN